MTTLDELRKYCEELHDDCQKYLKADITTCFRTYFIEAHRPFRAVIGNKKCRPIQVNRIVQVLEKCADTYFKTISEEFLSKELENLGFLVVDGYISVPPHKKGEKLSFAQSLVRDINNAYSKYCADTKKEAYKMYLKVISDLRYVPKGKIRLYDGYTLFCGYRFESTMSYHCREYLRRILRRAGIEEEYEGDKYIGIKVIAN